MLNDDRANVRGGLYRRYPWFSTDAHDPIPLAYSRNHRAIIPARWQEPGSRLAFLERIAPRWPSAGASRRLHGEARVRISRGALLQVGMDYWRHPTIGYGSGGNNHEAGASDWYFSSPQWREVSFTDIGGSQF